MVNVDDRLIDSLNEKELYMLLKIARRMRVYRMSAWPSIETLAIDCNWDIKKARLVRKNLLDKKLVSMEDRPGKSPVYKMKCNIGLFYGLMNVEVNEENGEEITENDPSPKSVPLPKIGSPHPSPKSVGEEINKQQVKVNEKSIYPKAKKQKSENTENAIKEMATMFDNFLLERKEEKFIWKTSAAHFKALKHLKEIILTDIAEAKLVEVNDENFYRAWGFILQYGYGYFEKISKAKGGAIEFKPQSLLNNYNSIKSHAKQQHNSSTKRDAAIRENIAVWHDHGDA